MTPKSTKHTLPLMFPMRIVRCQDDRFQQQCIPFQLAEIAAKLSYALFCTANTKNMTRILRPRHEQRHHRCACHVEVILAKGL